MLWTYAEKLNEYNLVTMGVSTEVASYQVCLTAEQAEALAQQLLEAAADVRGHQGLETLDQFPPKATLANLEV